MASSNNALNDTDLKCRLARYGIVSPITDTTRKILYKKLIKLETSSINKMSNHSVNCTMNNVELMDTSTNDLNEYEIRDGISKLGYNNIPLTDTTRPVISRIIRKQM